MHSFQRGSVLESDGPRLMPYALTPIEWVQFAVDKHIASSSALASQADPDGVTVSGLINGMRSHWQSHQLTSGTKLTEAEAEQLLNADIELYGEGK